jgi:hypothetical protein
VTQRNITIQGPLVRQPAIAARLAGAFVSAAEALWDAATLDDPAQMWEDGRAAASWALAACERVEDDLPKRIPPAPATAETGLAATGTDGQTLLPGLVPAHNDLG